MPGIKLSADHVYTVDGKRYDGVTTIIQLEGGSPGLEFVDPWYLQRGSMVHIATGLYDLGTLDEASVDERIKGYLTSWKRYRDNQPYVYLPEHIEVMLADHIYQYAGTLDRLPLLDIKCGAYKKADLAQLGAYYGLCQANKLPTDLYMGPEARRIIYLDENGEYPTVDSYSRSEVIAAMHSFLGALSWHRFKNSK
jgi:hypothetical protein